MNRRTGHGLGVDRYDSNLALYLPLWNKNCQPSTFYSLDNNRHSCTVTGATWGNKGYSFDGTDDKITFTDTGFPIGATDRTFLMWVKPTVVNKDYQEFFVYGTDAQKQSFMFSTDASVGAGTNKIILQTYLASFAASTGTISANVWQQIGVVLSSSTATYYINGVVAGDGGSIVDINTTLYSGTIGVSWNASYTTGQCGECILYSRALSSGEITRLYERTAWKYR